MKTFFFFDFDKNDIVTNLSDTAPGNDVFTFTSRKKAEFSWTGYDQCSDLSGFDIKFQIDRASKTATGTGIDHFFLSKFA